MEKKETTNWVMRIGSFVVSISIMVSSFFLNEAWNRINNIEKEVHELQISEASVSSSRFTAMDWQTNKSIIDQQHLITSQRILVVEENLKNLKEVMMEIRTDVKTIKERPQ